jgi:acyl carrier protein
MGVPGEPKTLPAENSSMSIRSVVFDQFQQVAIEQDMQLVPLSDELTLLDLGLDSLCFAIVVSRLETVLGVDPFSADEGAPFPVNLGEFVRFYENAVQCLTQP